MGPARDAPGADSSCSDASRMYNLPSRPAQARDKAQAQAGEGAAIDPDALPETPEEIEARELAAARARVQVQAAAVGLLSVGAAHARRAGERPGDRFNRESTWAWILEPHGWRSPGEKGGAEVEPPRPDGRPRGPQRQRHPGRQPLGLVQQRPALRGQHQLHQALRLRPVEHRGHWGPAIRASASAYEPARAPRRGSPWARSAGTGTRPRRTGAPGALSGDRKAGAATAIKAGLADLGYGFRLNEVCDQIELEDGRALLDGERANIIAALFDAGLRNKGLMEDVILALAWERRYDPLRAFLDGLAWDGGDHIGALAGHLHDAHPTILYAAEGRTATVADAFLRLWLVGAVGEVFDQVQNPMLVLAGDQDLGKDYLGAWLGSPLRAYFVESDVQPDETDHKRWAVGRLLWEVSELGATTRKADVEALKSFLTRRDFTYRVPYARAEVTRPLAPASSARLRDNTGFLNDPTGSRRFLCLRLKPKAAGGIDWAYATALDPRAVWAHAVALYRADPVVLAARPRGGRGAGRDQPRPGGG